ncbi:S8 family peptidase [Aminipila luticellarii]|uniref:Peptidase S8 n=1 Tax=Aminipila luticellarii TaxID=2507160 RepID=A0A410PVJ5_9FIRM|nr:S8 family peptidase [Aminipila luticellarii]QAT42945.1 peptidase S8 [Aminipila luticellarii]
MNKNNFLLWLFSAAFISSSLLPIQADSVFAGTDKLLTPQCVYYAAADKKSSVLTNDKMSSEQWALYNNGSFKIEEERNPFPVYEHTFKQPMNPGKWHKNAIHRNHSEKASAVSAEAGIDINISEAWDLYKSRRNVIIAMIDTGIDYNHEDLSDVMWINPDEIPGNGVDDDGNGYIDDIYGWNFYNGTNVIYTGEEDDHGTHGAGTITATKNNSVGISGIADEDAVSLMSLKVLGGEEGSGTTDSIIRAIQYAEENGASICNLSLGTTTYDRKLYDVMADSNMLFVVAAGNGDSDAGADLDYTPTYPAAFDLNNIISVANISYDGKLADNSNYGGSSVDIAAPGSYILSLTGDNGYAYMSGTSMAAPMVTAAAALVYTANEDLSLTDVKNVILANVTSLDSLSGKVSSGGMLNVGSALRYSMKKV